MNTIFTPSTISEFKNRIHHLNPEAEANWGKMSLYQMLKHCTENDRMLLREKAYRRLFIGRLFGRMALKSTIKDEQPMKPNGATHPDLIFKGAGDVSEQKAQWLDLLDKYAQQTEADYQDFVHPFFGKMTKSEVGRFAYKHIDHHLRQFGA
ncbi:MAG: DUF1569 domain-containing protein [Bacteroidota bacterium]